MKQINFSNPGGFPLEQETLERLQAAYRSELYEAIKSHLSIVPDTNYIITHAQSGKQGWAVIHENGEGILYPMTGGATDYLKTTKTTTSLVYGDGNSQNAYTDYNGEYVSALGTPTTTDKETISYYDLGTFKTVKSIQAIEEILQSINNKIAAIEDDLENYLPLDGSKAMKGDLNLGIYRLSKLDTQENFVANVRATDFNFGSETGRGKLHPGNFLGRAFSDSSNDSQTSLSVNYDSDWENTYIGGKVYLNHINSSNSNGSLLVLDGYNQVIKSNHLLDSLLARITKLEDQKSTAVPLGMIAIWGKTEPIPDGWEEYVPLRGRMPIGLDPNDSLFSSLQNYGGNKQKTLLVSELPPHDHDIAYNKKNAAGGGAERPLDNTGTSSDTQRTSQTGGGQPFSLMNPYQVVCFIVYTGRSNYGVNLTASNTSMTSTILSWTPANADFGVTNYLVYKNNILVETLGNVLTYTATALETGKLYNFYIIAKNATGTQSAPSNTVGVTTIKDDIPPTAPEYITSYITEQNQIRVEWSASTDNVGIERYFVYRRPFGGTFELLGTTAPNTTYFVTSGVTNQLYYFVVQSKDATDNFSPLSRETSAIIESTGGGGCFDIESLVTMASGQSKKLKNVVVGDKLQGLTFPNEIDESEGDFMLWNGLLSEASKAEVMVVSKKTSVQPAYFEFETEDTIFKVTGQHPLLVTEDGENLKWLCAKNVVQNMLLIDKAGKTKAIKSILFKEEALEVSSIDVETVDNYAIAGIIAHNKPVAPDNPEEPF
jgi:hypothetical protein